MFAVRMPTAIRPTTEETSMAEGMIGRKATEVLSRPGRLLSRSLRRRPRPRVLHVLIEPGDALGEHVEQRLARGVAVRFERQRHIADRGTVALERHVQPLGLNGERPRVVVGFAV